MNTSRFRVADTKDGNNTISWYIQNGSLDTMGKLINNLSLEAYLVRAGASVKEFGTFSDLFTRAVSGDRVTLVNNVQLAAPLTLNSKNIILSAEHGQEWKLTSTDATASLITVAGGGELTLGEGDVRAALALDGGGERTSPLVTVSGGKLTLKDGVILRNAANGGVASGDNPPIVLGTDYGGALALTEAGTVAMEGGLIGGGTTLPNKAGRGAGVYVQAGTFTMSGGEISDNSATNAGGGVYMEGGAFTMSGGKITRNELTLNSTGDRSGGGLFVKNTGGGNDKAVFTMSGGEVSCNWNKNNGVEDAGGGGLGFAGDGVGAFIKGGALIKANKSGTTLGASGSGNAGGIFLYNKATLTMTGGIVSENHAGGHGGGILVQGGTKNTTETEANKTILTLDKDPETGAIPLIGGAYYFNDSHNDGPVPAGALRGNYANNSVGGGIWAYRGGKVEFKHGKVAYNTADVRGGGIHVGDNGPHSKLYMYDGAEITRNKTTRQETSSGGGGICSWNFAKVYMTGGKITDNSVYGGFGGAVRHEKNTNNDGGTPDPTFIFSGGVMAGNYLTGYNTAQSACGGAFYTWQDCRFEMSGSARIGGDYRFDDPEAPPGALKGNKAGLGGGIYFNSGTGDNHISITGGTIDNNIATNNGGGINLARASNLPIGGDTPGSVKITGNRAGNDGGGIYSANTNNKTITLKNTIIGGSGADANHASSKGGGVYVGGPDGPITLNIAAGTNTISHNTAGTSGGGIYKGKTATIIGEAGNQVHDNTVNNKPDNIKEEE